MFKSFFSKSKVKVAKVEAGSHGDHWGALVGFKSLRDNENIVSNLITKAIENKKVYEAGKDYEVIKSEVQGCGLQIIVNSQREVIAFPLFESKRSLPFSIKIINEWDNSNSIEAQMYGAGRDTFALNFFATDYVENGKTYKENQMLDINLSGLAYVIKELPELSEGSLDNAIGYMPSEKVQDESVYDFIGIVLNVKEYAHDGISGFIVTTKLINHQEMKDFFVLDLFINEENLRAEKLFEGMRIAGCFWLQGSIAKK